MLQRELIDNLNTNVATLLKGCDIHLVGFSPLNHLCKLLIAYQDLQANGIAASLRLSCAPLLLITHQIISDQLSFQKSLKPAYIVDDLDGSSPQDYNLALLEELRLQSIDLCLHTCRSQAEMIEVRPLVSVPDPQKT